VELLTLALLLVILYDVLDRRLRGISQVPLKLEVTLTPPTSVLEEEEGELQEPLPREVLDYIDLESDEWARSARRTMARKYYAKLQSWDAVLHQLKAEDKFFDL